MKYCPYCGADIIDGAVSFCVECGKQLPSVPQKQKKDDSYTKEKKNSRIPKSAIPDTENPDESDIGYDGYYEDRVPEDNGAVRMEIDKRLIKRLVILGICVLLVIILCVAMIYLL